MLESWIGAIGIFSLLYFLFEAARLGLGAEAAPGAPPEAAARARRSDGRPLVIRRDRRAGGRRSLDRTPGYAAA